MGFLTGRRILVTGVLSNRSIAYGVALACQREGATLLRAKMWRQGDDEPDAWMVETEDSTPELQNQRGSFANDVYNYSGTGSVWVHEVAIARM